MDVSCIDSRLPSFQAVIATGVGAMMKSPRLNCMPARLNTSTPGRWPCWRPSCRLSRHEHLHMMCGGLPARNAATAAAQRCSGYCPQTDDDLVLVLHLVEFFAVLGQRFAEPGSGHPTSGSRSVCSVPRRVPGQQRSPGDGHGQRWNHFHLVSSSRADCCVVLVNAVMYPTNVTLFACPCKPGFPLLMLPPPPRMDGLIPTVGKR